MPETDPLAKLAEPEHPLVKFGHETSAGMVSIFIFESFHAFVTAPFAALVGVALTVVAVYHLKKKAGLHQ